LDERRVVLSQQAHRIAAIEQHVEISDLFGERDKHRSLGRADLHQQPVPFTLLADDLTLEAFPRRADGLGQVRCDQLRAPAHQTGADEECADEDHPPPHGSFSTISAAGLVTASV
jgi:hypothetical protein